MADETTAKKDTDLSPDDVAFAESLMTRPTKQLPLKPVPDRSNLDAVRRAPAVHGEELWDGARYIHNATSEPVFVETKKQYWELLARTGFRMTDQAESTTGPAVAPDPKPIQDI